MSIMCIELWIVWIKYVEIFIDDLNHIKDAIKWWKTYEIFRHLSWGEEKLDKYAWSYIFISVEQVENQFNV